jgi:hypothetical protein
VVGGNNPDVLKDAPGGHSATRFRNRRADPSAGGRQDELVSIARLTEWRERALAGAATALKERERDDRDDEIARRPGWRADPRNGLTIDTSCLPGLVEQQLALIYCVATC